jgi:hypothetical protein
MPDYLDLELKIEGTGGRYTAEILHSPGGEASNTFALPAFDEDLERAVLVIAGYRRSRRDAGSPELEAARSLGRMLFETVFSPEIRDVLRRSQTEAKRREGIGLRLKLRLQKVPELADLPWEFLFDPSVERFFAQSIFTPIVRYVEAPEPVEPLVVEPPMRLLALAASPPGQVRLDVRREKAVLQEALAPLTAQGKLRLDWLEDATLSGLRRQLRDGEYHALHFVGHGRFDSARQEGLLLFEDEEGASSGQPVDASHLGTHLRDHPTLRLVVLNACEGARNSRTDPFAGVATTLVWQGIPAVVAMQFEITDDAAIAFAGEFYAAISNGLPVDAAVAEGRKAILDQPNDVEWATPVLYMRSPDGVLFNLKETEASAVGRGLAALAELMRSREVREAVVRFQADLKATSEQIVVLAGLKRLHDRLQQLEDRYRLIYHDARQVSQEADRWDDLDRLEPELQATVEDLMETARLVSEDQAFWMQKVGQARGELRDAVERRDVEILKTSTRRLNEVLGTQPSRVNTRLITAAENLRLAALVQDMITVRDSSAGLPHDAASARQLVEFEQGVANLAKLDVRLRTLRDNHESMQEIDDILRRVEALLEQDIGELQDAWQDLRQLARRLSDGDDVPWRTRLDALGAELETALATSDPVKIKRQFRSYRSQALRGFNQVDRDLLTLCEELQTIGGPLESLLKVLDNG